MAACSWLAERFACDAARASCATTAPRASRARTQDIGTGTYTVLAQLASEKLELPIEKVEVVLGDTRAPAGADLGRLDGDGLGRFRPCSRPREKAIDVAARERRRRVAFEAQADELALRERPRPRRRGDASGMPFAEVLRRANMRSVSGTGSAEGTFQADEPKFSSHSFGAHFVEVTWQPEIARLRVSRVVSVIDAGRILNPLAGRNQIEGAVVMGIGMALFEETAYDPRNGAPDQREPRRLHRRGERRRAEARGALPRLPGH